MLSDNLLIYSLIKNKYLRYSMYKYLSKAEKITRFYKEQGDNLLCDKIY